ncbi:MAG: rhodanese-like domain-containing protein [Gammaproteobacteria bacterium]
MERLSVFVVKHWVLVSGLIAVVAALIWDLVRASKGRAPQIWPTELIRLMNREEAVVIDVRDKSAYKKGHIAGALSIPLAEAKQRIAEIDIDRKRPIVLYCHSGNTSVGAVGDLVKAGFENIYRLKGGMLEWQDSHLPVTKD